MNITYREMNTLDLPVVVSMERQVYKIDPWSVGQFKEELAAVPRNRYYVVACDENQQLLGYAGIFSPDAEFDAEIMTLTVGEDFRRKGIGRHLLQLITEWSKKREAPAIFLEMREGNIEANPLYLSEGFAQVSHRKNYYQAGVHAIVMKKDLP